MSPRSPRYPSPASGDDAATSGRHRRPETLAEMARPRTTSTEPAEDELALTRAALTAPSALYRALGEPTPTSPFPTLTPRSRAARSRQERMHSAAAHASEARRSPETGATGPRHSRHSAATRSAATRPPAGGSHRAPRTLPIESWLLMGKKLQQVLFASLVAAALLLIGIPMRQEGIDAVDAAAGGAIGVHVGKTKPKQKETKPAHDPAAADPRATSPAPKPSGSPSAKAPASQVKLPTGSLGPGHSLRTTGSKAISLTFDDGPDPVQTPKMLALLAQYHVKATFCLVGSNVEKHPEVVRQIVAAGHTLCNHTWNHSLTIGKDKPAKIQDDLERTNAAIRAAVPGAEIPFFRAPGGNFTDRLVQVAKAQGMTSLYWQVDPRDWDHPKGEDDPGHIARVIAEIKKSVKPGSIILSHDFNQPDTIEAYAKVLPWLTANFTTTIPELPASPAPPASPSATPSTSPAAGPAAVAGPGATPNPASDS